MVEAGFASYYSSRPVYIYIYASISYEAAWTRKARAILLFLRLAPTAAAAASRHAPAAVVSDVPTWARRLYVFTHSQLAHLRFS